MLEKRDQKSGENPSLITTAGANSLFRAHSLILVQSLAVDQLIFGSVDSFSKRPT